MNQAISSPRDLRQQALTDAKRKHILSAATAVFIEFGLEAVSMREIANALAIQRELFTATLLTKKRFMALYLLNHSSA